MVGLLLLVAAAALVVAALGFALFIPQFVFQQPVRVGHGLLVAAAC